MMSNLPPLTEETILAILNEELDDITVNQLVWHYLGYRYDEANGKWDNTQVADDWRTEYPEPPDFIGHRPPTVKLTRSIPSANKQLLKEKLGFQGYDIGGLVPRLTRRTTMAGWLYSYMHLV